MEYDEAPERPLGREGIYGCDSRELQEKERRLGFEFGSPSFSVSFMVFLDSALIDRAVSLEETNLTCPFGILPKTDHWLLIDRDGFVDRSHGDNLASRSKRGSS